MDITPTSLPGVLIVDLRTFRDDRGFFVERYHEEKFRQLGLPVNWVQDNHARSRRGVLRGLHYQLPRPQGKLVSCLSGTIFDVAVDIRVGSPTLAKWVGVELSGDAPRLLWVPEGFAHGYVVLSDSADVSYKCTELYVPSADRGVRWNDADIGIDWPVKEPVLSPKDLALPSLRDAKSQLPRYDAPAAMTSAR